MASWRRAILYGLLIWLIPFAVALSLSSIRESWRALFESIMPVAVTLAVVLFALRYFRRVDGSFVKEGVLLGFVWMLISVLIDLPLMLSPPMNMSLVDYAADVGLTYFIMPIVTVGMSSAFGAARPVAAID